MITCDHNEKYQLKVTFAFDPKSHFEYQMWSAFPPCAVATLPVADVNIHLRLKISI